MFVKWTSEVIAGGLISSSKAVLRCHKWNFKKTKGKVFGRKWE